MSSVTGCFSMEILEPGPGSSIFGAEISTPGIGPATLALSGFELLLASHAVSDNAAARTPTVARIRDITFTRRNVGTHHGHVRRSVQFVLSARRSENFKKAVQTARKRSSCPS